MFLIIAVWVVRLQARQWRRVPPGWPNQAAAAERVLRLGLRGALHAVPGRQGARRRCLTLNLLNLTSRKHCCDTVCQLVLSFVLQHVLFPPGRYAAR